MKMATIQFADKQASAKGIAALMRRGRVVCLPGDIFVVPEPALAALTEMGLKYEVLAEEGWDRAVRALRDSAPAPVQ